MGVIWTPLQPKQPITFFDPTVFNSGDSTTYFQPQLNPATMAFTPGNVRKYINTTNGSSVIIGDREYPPMEIKMGWDELDDSDLEQLVAYCGISPIVYVDNNDNGYLGVLVIDQLGQIAGKSAKVYSVQASFLVIGPYNGFVNQINNARCPASLDFVKTPTGGYIKDNVTFYVWGTIFTETGESLVGNVLAITTGSTGSDANYVTINYNDPYNGGPGHPLVPYVKVRLYWNSANHPAGATFLTDIQSGFSNQFIIYSNVANYSSQVPPVYTTAFTGYWAGGRWIQTIDNNPAGGGDGA